ncbi:MAG TPA: GAF domain-containing SpoIIE family protein phosphatase [Candidatus Acidoferrales bacterium]|nr:GAF domain-containing SpoIIE family protein phosphatase [Candidatus Acidoferrales bacterium]
MKKAKKAARSGAAAAGARLEALDKVFVKLNPEAEPGELAAEIVRSLAAPGVLEGARLWKMVDGAATVWHESGKLPAANAALVAGVLKGKHEPSANGLANAWTLGRGETPVGVLEIASKSKMDGKTRAWLDLFRRYAEVALESSERRSAVIELSTIVEATKRLNSTLDLAELLNIILGLTIRHSGAERGTVFLVDREKKEIWSLVGLGLEQHEIRLPITKGIAGWVAQHGEMVNLADAYSDSRFESEVDLRLGYRTKSLLCLPIRNKGGETIGVLQLLNKKTGPFSRADENMLQAISDHVALALENAQLHREMVHKQRMERDLALARSIQMGLLPESPPKLQGFDIAVSNRMSLEAGGDYYDFIQLAPDTMLTVVADVEGKGVGSAMVMANLQATLHALLAHLHSLERLVESLNDMMLADTRGQKYMTMFLTLLDQPHRTLHYVNAGHVPPAVVRANGTVEYLREGGMVVGMFPGVHFDRGHVKLEVGDIFVACTDGITEAMNAQDDEFGSPRLAELVARERALPAEEIVQSVLTEVDLFSRGGTHEDDRVILILKVV